MDILDISAIVITLSAAFAVLNYHFLKMSPSIGVMFISLLFSSVALVLKYFGLIDISFAQEIVNNINFSKTLVNGMLGALLFAGALQIKVAELKSRLSVILILATFGVVASTFIVGYLTYYMCQFFGADISLMYCLAFGALISPTDPIAVLAILRRVGVSKYLEMDVTGESLFNDGIGYVVFTLLLGLAMGNESITPSELVVFFSHEALGGIVFGFVISYGSYLLIKTIKDNYHIQILITLALVVGGYNLAGLIGVSAPLAIVVAGIVTGNLSRKAMHINSKRTMEIFWEIIDDILNCILFVLIGAEVLGINWNYQYFNLGFFAIIIVLFGRWISVALPVSIMQRNKFFSPRSIKILTWGGLRGGLSVAMALLLPEGDEKQIILIMTYSCVIFSILIQGTTIKRLAGDRTLHDDGTPKESTGH